MHRDLLGIARPVRDETVRVSGRSAARGPRAVRGLWTREFRRRPLRLGESVRWRAERVALACVPALRALSKALPRVRARADRRRESQAAAAQTPAKAACANARRL